MNFFHHKDLGNHILQLCRKVVKHPVLVVLKTKIKIGFDSTRLLFRFMRTGFALSRRSQKCLSVSAKTPANACLSKGGGVHLEILGGKSTFPTKVPQI